MPAVNAAPDQRTPAAVDLSPRGELHRLMRGWRERLDPRSIPGLRTERRRSLSQETVAHLVGASSLWYGRLERGEIGPSYSDDFLDRVAITLRLDDNERRVLYLLAVGREPVPRVRRLTPAVARTLHELVNAVPYPSWLSDPAWDVQVCNPAMRRWFPHLAYEQNIMRWVYCYPESRLQLANWAADWATPMLAQMRAALARWPANTRLAGLIDEALTVNGYARRLWHERPKVSLHPDGERRWLHLPFLHRRDPVQVEIVAATPMRSGDLRWVTLVPVDEDDRHLVTE
jgi:transcriptional regulator with XRE-family HTH domain